MQKQFMSQNSNKHIILSLLLACLPLTSHALSEDVEKPLNIESDTAEFDNSNGTATYVGNVLSTQGTLEIKSETLNIQAPENEIETVTAKGTPVNFQQQMDDGKMVVGHSQTMIYLVKEKKLILKGNAELQLEKDVIENDHIEYYVDSGELHAGNKNTKQKGDRVKAVFHPTNKANPSPQDTANKKAEQ
jgi:lipopolysaccharide export system protein LptA